jgi:hypothetical protein
MQKGVSRVLQLLNDELVEASIFCGDCIDLFLHQFFWQTMKLCGVCNVSEISSEYVARRPAGSMCVASYACRVLCIIVSYNAATYRPLPVHCLVACRRHWHPRLLHLPLLSAVRRRSAARGYENLSGTRGVEVAISAARKIINRSIPPVTVRSSTNSISNGHIWGHTQSCN